MRALPAPDGDSVSGEYIPAGSQGLGAITDPHTDESAADDLRGKPETVDTEAITKEWVLQRLLKEATDFGTRTRQSSRVKALELLGKHLAMFTEVVETKDPVRDALKDLDPWERKKRILDMAARMAADPSFTAKVAEKVAK